MVLGHKSHTVIIKLHKVILQVKHALGAYIYIYIYISELPTFRNCLEGETSSAKRKNSRVGSRSRSVPPGGPWEKALDRGEGSKAAPSCVKKILHLRISKCIISGPFSV